MKDIHQGSMLTDTTFCVSICDVEDIAGVLIENGVPEKLAKIRAQELIDEPKWRSKFVDALMSDFNETLENVLEDES